MDEAFPFLSSYHVTLIFHQLELIEPDAQAKLGDVDASSFLSEAKKHVSKGAKPDRLRLGSIPRNFKGDINWRELEADWKKHDAEGKGK